MTAPTIPDLPAAPRVGPDRQLEQIFIDKIREVIQTRDPVATKVGDVLDKFVTRRELVGSGLEYRSGYFGPGSGVNGNGGPGIGTGGTTYVVDLTPPPTPTGLTVNAGISTLIIGCAAALYSQGHGHDRTLVFGAKWPTSDPTAPTFSEAVPLMEFQGTVASYSTDPSTRWCIWIKWQSIDGVPSTDPAGGVNGVQATTGVDVSLLLDALNGQITASELNASLSDRIDLIDGTMAGSVTDRISAEAAARGAAITAESLIRQTAEASLATQITLISAGTSEQFDPIKIWYFDTGVEGWTGNGTPTQSGTFIRPANQASDPWIASPTGIGAAAPAYTQLRLRIRKTGTLTWDGLVYWRTPSDSTWDIARSDALTEPSYDVNGFGLVTVNMSYTGTLDRIRLDLSTSADASNYFQVDWVAVGRPAPGASTAALADEVTARATADAAEVTSRQTLATKLTGLADPSGSTLGSLTSGLIFDERTARSTADGSLASDISLVSASAATNTAAIATEITARASGDAANASAITTVQSSVANIAFESNTTWDFNATADGWTFTGGTATTTADWLHFASTGIDPIAMSPALSLSGLRYDKVRARVRRTAGTTWDGNLFYGIASGHSFDANFRKIIADTTVLNQWVILEWDMAALTVGGSDWVSSTITQIRIDLGTSAADAFDIDWVAIGRRGTGVSSASVQTEITTRATQTGALFAQYTVKLDVNGYVSGFGLASTSTGATPYSNFIFKADQFAFGAPGQSSVYPFVIQATPTTINGVPVPAGVYIDAAYILRGSITNAQIGNAVIDDAKVSTLSAAVFTGGVMRVGSYLQSTNYIASVQGFRINASGNVEFENGTFRGTVYASAGSFAGDISAANGNFRGSVTGGAISGYAWPAAGSGPGFYLGTYGLLLGNYNDGKYFQVEASGNVYAPGFSIVNGAAKFDSVAVGAVNTVNIVPGAVTGSGKSGEVTLSYAPTSFNSFNTGSVGLYYLVTTGAYLLLGATLAVNVTAAPSGFYLNVKYWLTIDGVDATTDPQASFSNIQSTTSNTLYFSSAIVGMVTGVSAANHLFGLRAVVSFTNNAGNPLGMAYANFTIKANQYTTENKV